MKLEESVRLQSLEAAQTVKTIKVCNGELTVAIEVPKGSTRTGKDKTGKAWSVKLPFAYGHIVGAKGMDGEALDCYIGPQWGMGGTVYVVHMNKNIDNEDKCMIGFGSKVAAKRAFLKCYQNKEEFFGGMDELSTASFVRKVKAGKSHKRITAAYVTDGIIVMDSVPRHFGNVPQNDGSRTEAEKAQEAEYARRQGKQEMVERAQENNSDWIPGAYF